MKSKVIASVLATVIAVFLAAAVSAEEGMWPHYDVDRLPFEKFRTAGLELEPTDIYNPQGGGLCEAVVRLGATGSFVSKEGLIVTNHHVAFGAIQKQSTAERNLLRDGFYASTREEEIPAIGYSAMVIRSTEDVTERILSSLSAEMEDYERNEAIDLAIKKIVAEGEANEDVKCRVAEMFGGQQYILYTEFRIRDIRIVYVPPAAIGEYGGDIDNWMWPRHTGDFSFLRAYVGPDGSSAELAAENVPYHPNVFLPIATGSLSDGDFAMIIGFPGKTSRYAPSKLISDLVEFSYPDRIELYRDILDIIASVSRDDPEAAVRLASLDNGINNGLKNRIGMLEGFQKWNLLQKKIEMEMELEDFISSRPDLSERFGSVLAGLDSMYQQKALTREKDVALSNLGWSDYVDIAFTIYKWSREREKPDIERERGYQDRDSVKIREWLEDVQVNMVEEFEREVLRYALGRTQQLPEGQRITSIDNIIASATGVNREEKLQVWLDQAFANTKVGYPESRMAMFGMSIEELEGLNDPFIELARLTYDEREERVARRKKLSGMASRLDPKLIAAYAEWKGSDLYPDANGTMRINFGVVKGYSPADAVNYSCFTGFRGVLEKETGEDPFIVPAELRQYHNKGMTSAYFDSDLGDIPVNVLTTNDATGGNSGSPVIDGKGRLVGLLFDCNYESIAADYLFNPELTRSISVDIRYVLHVIDEVYGLDELMNELTLQ
ncbi:MAG: S46 family peptidase [Candidatus Zixiibacteriota bacterium]|nr:MAG: S46 family peptidase [candidate division Zixibacteria bacterium]